MVKGTGRFDAPEEAAGCVLPLVSATRPAIGACDERSCFPERLRDWLATDGGLLRSLVALRRLGAEGSDAVVALLAVRRVAALRWSWELWRAIAEGDGDDPETLLLEVLPLHVVEQAQRALWGDQWS